ncbi:MAG: flavodoxin domain-containing protein [Candidatus Thorarchaeota archaeon]
MDIKSLERTPDTKSVVIVYDSLFGNTKKIAMSLSRGLEAGGLPVDSFSINKFDVRKLMNYQVIGIGSPTHMRGVSKPMKLFLSKMKRLNLKNKKVFAFETKASFRFSGSAAKKILRTIKMMKIEVFYPIITGFVVGKEGPLEGGTLTNVEEMGLNIAEKLKNYALPQIKNLRR